MKEIITCENSLTVQQFQYLYNSTKWDTFNQHQIEKALQNDKCHVSAWIGDEIVGMGRLIGDASMYWYIQNLIVLPKYQLKGVGTAIMNYLLAFIHRNTPLNSHVIVGLMCSQHTASFYQKFSFEIRPHHNLGPGATLEFDT